MIKNDTPILLATRHGIRKQPPRAQPHTSVGGPMTHVGGDGSSLKAKAAFGIGAIAGGALMLTGSVLSGAFVMLGGLIAGTYLDKMEA